MIERFNELYEKTNTAIKESILNEVYTYKNFAVVIGRDGGDAEEDIHYLVVRDVPKALKFLGCTVDVVKAGLWQKVTPEDMAKLQSGFKKSKKQLLDAILNGYQQKAETLKNMFGSAIKVSGGLDKYIQEEINKIDSKLTFDLWFTWSDLKEYRTKFGDTYDFGLPFWSGYVGFGDGDWTEGKIENGDHYIRYRLDDDVGVRNYNITKNNKTVLLELDFENINMNDFVNSLEPLRKLGINIYDSDVYDYGWLLSTKSLNSKEIENINREIIRK